LLDIFDGNGDRLKIERYTEWTPTQVKITDVDVTTEKLRILASPTIIANKVGEVPIALFRYKRDKRNRFMGASFLRDLAYNNREVMNLTSLLQEFLYRQCFNILAIQTDPNLPTANQKEGETGTANTLEYPKGADAPKYVAPDAAPAKFLQDERQRIVQEMYKRAAQDTVNELFNGGKASGFSKAQSFASTVPQIASRAETLEKGENRLMELTMRYMRKKWDGKIKYKDRYELTNLTDALGQLTDLFTKLQVKSKTLLNQEVMRMIHEIDGKIPPETLKTIQAEVDGTDWAEVFDTFKLSLIGNAGQPPAGANGAPAGPVKGKDTPPRASNKTRKTSTTSEIKSEATKTPKAKG
jgi:hypothetical protein